MTQQGKLIDALALVLISRRNGRVLEFLTPMMTRTSLIISIFLKSC